MLFPHSPVTWLIFPLYHLWHHVCMAVIYLVIDVQFALSNCLCAPCGIHIASLKWCIHVLDVIQKTEANGESGQASLRQAVIWLLFTSFYWLSHMYFTSKPNLKVGGNSWLFKSRKRGGAWVELQRAQQVKKAKLPKVNKLSMLPHKEKWISPHITRMNLISFWNQNQAVNMFISAVKLGILPWRLLLAFGDSIKWPFEELQFLGDCSVFSPGCCFLKDIVRKKLDLWQATTKIWHYTLHPYTTPS